MVESLEARTLLSGVHGIGMTLPGGGILGILPPGGEGQTGIMMGPVAPVAPIAPVSPIGGIGAGTGGVMGTGTIGVAGGVGPVGGVGLGNRGIGGIGIVHGPVGTTGGVRAGGVPVGTRGSTSGGGLINRPGSPNTATPTISSASPTRAARPLAVGINASAQLTLVGTTGTGANQTFHYSITVTNTGTTTIGTFWFSWVPGADFLPSRPITTASPVGWHAQLTGLGNPFDGTAIQWVAGTTAALIQPGQSLSGFEFTTPDSPQVLAGNAPTNPSQKVLTAFVYIAAPEADPGMELQVTENTTTPPATPVATATTLAASSPSATAGTNITFTARVTPASGNVLPTGTVTFLENGTTLGTANVQPDGTASFTTNTLPVGLHVLTAHYAGDANFNASTSPQFSETITPAAPPPPPPAATHLSIAQQPPLSVAAGHALGTIVVDLLKQNGAVDTTNNSSVTLSISAGGHLRGAFTVNAVHGVATFKTLSITTAGRFTLSVRDGTLTAAHTRAMTITPDTATARLALVSGGTGHAVVGANVLPPIVVRSQDQFGNLVNSDHSKVVVSVAGGPGKISGNVSALFANGVATLKGFSLATAGAYSLRITDASLPVKTPLSVHETVTKATAALPVPPIAKTYPPKSTISLAATLHSNSPVPFSGTARIVDSNNIVLATARVAANGVVKFTIKNLAPGLHAVTVRYPGDANHLAAASPRFNLVVAPAKT
ncbi:MAG: Ig-like domain-containing protein [Phycisphaerae bacterium]